MTIQWYPGHMEKAKRQVTEQLKRVDAAVELVDARIPFSSRNPMLDNILEDKPRIVVLTKSDMADPDVSAQWLRFYEEQGAEALTLNALQSKGAKPVVDKAEKVTAPIFDKMKRKGIRPRAIRAMILGIPNVGKSTVINRLVGKKTAKTGDKPGITKAQQWLKVGNKMELLDTPGILWPKFEDQMVGYRLAATGAIKDERLDMEDIALYLTGLLKERYPAALRERYRLEELPADDRALFTEIGKKRGCLQAGGYVDEEQCAALILREFRDGKLGRLSLETPADHEEKKEPDDSSKSGGSSDINSRDEEAGP
ncbi:ribosome biogenesis GTPase YlqF [Salibacterium qingdaonense]|uniref:Ribosome biogenesis GTPase A n=1 Tax=Salibacterium qingdaonense TaxID=266892 RepID=A0A1I4PGS8_9BACI|nr:ribosome biogenesis GTPase YlqF [Salibacterium qingdaonense]SFM26907.1 Ras superfamily GTP-binding protein YlqF [Salibacterium qingdaonense]